MHQSKFGHVDEEEENLLTLCQILGSAEDSERLDIDIADTTGEFSKIVKVCNNNQSHSQTYRKQLYD